MSRKDSFSTRIDNSHIDLTLERDALYTKLLREYVSDKIRTDIIQCLLRVSFFVVVCIIFVGIVCLGAACVMSVLFKEQSSWADAGIVLSGLASILGATVILPSKIADHLFPADLNSDLVQIIQHMQTFDIEKDSCSDITTYKYRVSNEQRKRPDL